MFYTPLHALPYVVPEKKWTELDAAQHRAHAMRLLDGLEVIRREKRLNVARAVLYMAQGECHPMPQSISRKTLREKKYPEND